MKRRLETSGNTNDNRTLIEITQELENILERNERRAYEAQLRKSVVSETKINDRLFGPPVPVNKELEAKIKKLFIDDQIRKDPTFIVTLNGVNKKRKISLSEYKARQTENIEIIVTVPDKFEEIHVESLKPEWFTKDDIYNCVRAAIRTLPAHLAAAFTVSSYLWPTPLSVKPTEKWKHNIIGFEPRIPPPVRQPPKYVLKNNFTVPPPATEKQHRYWKKHWRRIENIVLNDIRIYLQYMVREIMIEFARLQKKF